MGFMSKIKNIFYGEVEEEEEVVLPKKEIKKEIKKDIVNNDDKQTKTIKEEVINDVKSDNTFSERELFRSDRAFNFTEFDDDEIVIEPPRINAMDLDKRSNRLDRVENPIREVDTKPKAFKPSPVISPIYGILDKDYVKEEIKERKTEVKSNKTETFTYDTVRRKAYGSDLDEIGSTEVKDSVDSIEKEVDKLNQKANKIEDLISRIEKDDKSNITVGEIEDNIKNDKFETDFEKTVSDDTLEHDLFNLIDSMYDDKED